jgi:ribosomal protein S9
LIFLSASSSPSPPPAPPAPTPFPFGGKTLPNYNLVPGYPALNRPLEPEVGPLGPGSDGAYLGSVSEYVGYATGTITIGGTPATGNTVITTINGNPVTYTLVGGDTTTALVATHVAGAINANGTNAAKVTATSTGPIVTITPLVKGVPGNYSLTVSVTGGGVTATASAARLLFANNLYVAKVTFEYNLNGPKTFYKGVGYAIDPANAAAMFALGYLY